MLSNAPAASVATVWVTWAVVSACWAIGETSHSQSEDRGAQAATRISGQIATDSGRALPETIVYLESADPSRRFEPPSKPAVISQKGARFSPSLLVVAAGQTVNFLNDEERPIEHNVFSRAPVKSFDLGLYRPGISKSVTFDEPGVVPLYCSIHRYMDGVIFVSPTPLFARVDAEGRYVIADVPPGEYSVKTWQRSRRYREQSRPISVQSGQAMTVDFEMSRE